MSILQLNLNSATNLNCSEENSIGTRESKFFRRQFQSEATGRQKVFDWIFGVIMPTVCFAFDPIVFRNSPGGLGLLGDYTPFAYLLSFTLIMATLALLLFGNRFGAFNAILSGLFAVGGIVALFIGIILIPFSLLGILFYFVGLLGFTPLLTAFVYLRSARRTFTGAKPHLRRSALTGAFVFGAVLTAAVPTIINAQIYRLLMEMKSGDAAVIKTNARILRPILPLVNTRLLVDACLQQSDANRVAAAKAYLELTGQDINKTFYFNCND